MAGEIVVTSAIEVRKDEFLFPVHTNERKTFNQANIGGGGPGAISIPVAGANIDLSKFGTVGWCKFINTDPDNFVEWGAEVAAVFHPIGRMEPLEPAGPFRLSPGKTLHLKADTAACEVHIIIFED